MKNTITFIAIGDMPFNDVDSNRIRAIFDVDEKRYSILLSASKCVGRDGKYYIVLEHFYRLNGKRKYEEYQSYVKSNLRKYDYTKDSILKLVNKLAGTNFDDIVIEHRTEVD